jgi:hypothetical protein
MTFQKYSSVRRWQILLQVRQARYIGEVCALVIDWKGISL